MKSQTHTNKTSILFTRILAIFIAVCLVITAIWIQYYNSLYNTIRAESKGYLQEVSRRICSNVSRIIDDNFAVLYTMAASVETASTQSLDHMRGLLQRQQASWNYESIMLVDDTGKAYDLSGREVFLEFDNSMREAMLRGCQSMSTAQIINNQEYIIFSVPMDNLRIEEKNIVALAAGYSPASFDQTLSMASFNEQAYSQIITNNGIAVTRPSSPYAIKTGYNVFSSLQNSQPDNGMTWEKVRYDFSSGAENLISFTFDGVARYMVYTPVSGGDWYLLTFVPGQVVNEKSDLLLRTTLIICALITLAFAGLCAALVFLFNANKRKLEQIAYVDEVTGGNTIQRFYELVTHALDSFPAKRFAVVYTNIEKFKVLNEQFGSRACDSILKAFCDFVSPTLSGPECMGRVSADNFCLLMEFQEEEELIDRFRWMRSNSEKFLQEHNLLWGLPVTNFGIYVLENHTLPLPQMIDRAKLALRENLCPILDNKMHYAFYDDGLRRQLFREKQLEDKMEAALAGREFQMYLQPKYHLPEESVGGAEALVRWISPEEGMIYPNDFIPLFEKNGFIVQLDLWVFEEACRTLRAWIDRGLSPVKISVNCSRVHFRTINFLEPYIQLSELYGVDKGLLEIELTESIVFENSEHLTDIIRSIRDAGFGCSMDDFGSGYSSLNLIQSIPVDTLKLDKIFFQNSLVDADRTEAVVTNIIGLARSLSMATVAEGVEHREQVAMLKRAGCDYIQGYVFSKPVNLEAFEALTFGSAEQV